MGGNVTILAHQSATPTKVEDLLATDGALHVDAVESIDSTVIVDVGALSQTRSLSGTSAQTAALTVSRYLVWLTEPAFVRQGANPTAVSTGVDMYVPAEVWVRLGGITVGNKLAFITGGGTGTAYLTPSA